jgi:hypothetical protein
MRKKSRIFFLHGGERLLSYTFRVGYTYRAEMYIHTGNLMELVFRTYD